MPASDALQFQVDTLRSLVANVTPEQMSSPTPCDKWTVRDLLNHIVGGGHIFAGAYRGEGVPGDLDAPMPDFVGDDPVAALEATFADFNDAVNQPGAMDKIVTLPFGQLPGAVVMEIAKMDLTIHAWDLATATGQSFDPPADVVEPLIAGAQMVISPEARDGDTFKDEVAVDAQCRPIERLVAYSGRSI